MAPTMKREWTTNLLRDVLELQGKPQLSEPTYAEYCANECFIAVTKTRLIHMEWCRETNRWWETEGGESFGKDVPLSEKLRLYHEASGEEIIWAADLEGDEDDIWPFWCVYMGLRSERLEDAQGKGKRKAASAAEALAGPVETCPF